MKTLIIHTIIVNEGCAVRGSLLIEDGLIADVMTGDALPDVQADEVIDAEGCWLLPGVIDDHVHFREPGLTQKADIDTESRAAAYGGVTSYFDMPNTLPQTTSLEALQEKFDMAARKSHVNYSFFFGLTNNNAHLVQQLDRTQVPGVKLFMGSSTGNMLVDRRGTLEDIFAHIDLPIMAHCEDTQIINDNMKAAKEQYGDDPDVAYHPLIRSEEACYRSTALAVQLARKHHARLHVAHVTTARELQLFEPWTDGEMPRITAEAVVAHLCFCNDDYTRLGTRIKCNPAVKTKADRDALRQALTDGRIAVVGTDHAPHLLKDKEGGCARAASGMPMLQFSLVAMLQLVDEGVLTVERVVELMCHRPALLFGVEKRGFVRKGYHADLVIVRPNTRWTVTPEVIQSKCGWSPMEGREFHWQVEHTFCNGHHIYNKGVFDDASRGEAVQFNS